MFGKTVDELEAERIRIWNEAIETAALRAERTYQHITIANSIRKLKK